MTTPDERKLGETPAPTSATLNLPARGDYIAAALDFTETLLTGQGYVREEVMPIRLAVEELMEFLKHATLRDRGDTPITVTYESQADGVSIRLRVKGMPINTQALPGYDPAAATDEPDMDGLSLFLAKKVVDRLVFANHGRDGLEVELFKHRSSAHIESRMPACSGEQETATSADDPGSYVIRPLAPEEALEVSRCAYLTYGHTYEDFIYYPERIVELNQSGEMRSLVAVSEGGEIMGHCALKFAPNRRDRAELGVLFVKPAFRKHGLGAALWGATVDFGRTLKVDSIFARSVTGHRASQTMAVHFGFKDCALSLSLFPRAVDLREMGGLQRGKMSGMLQVLPLNMSRSRRINPPAQHAEMVAELYRRAGIPTQPGTAAACMPGDEPVFRITRVPVLNVAIVEVERIGDDAEVVNQWITSVVRRLCAEKLDVIQLYLHVEDARSSVVADHCTAEGFIFSGIAPGAFVGGDAVALQYLNLAEDPFSDMTVWTDTAQYLRDYIHAQWKDMKTEFES